MRAAALLPSGALIIAGAVFSGQGFGLIPGSFMTGSRFWAVTGILMIVFGVILLVAVARRGSAG